MSIKITDLADLHMKIAAFGTYSDLTCRNVQIQAHSGGETCTLSGDAYFSSGTRRFDAVLVRYPSGNWKIMSFFLR